MNQNGQPRHHLVSHLKRPNAYLFPRQHIGGGSLYHETYYFVENSKPPFSHELTDQRLYPKTGCSSGTGIQFRLTRVSVPIATLQCQPFTALITFVV